MQVAIFTDNDFDMINGITTTLKAVLRFAPADIQPRIYTLADLGVDVPDYLALSSMGMPVPFHSEMRMYLPRFKELARHAASDQVQLVHLTTPGPCGLAARYISRTMGLPMIGSLHTQLSECAAGSSWMAKLKSRYVRWMYGACREVLVPSQDTRTRLSIGGWPRDRVSVWPRGVDCEAFSPSRRSAILRQRWGVSDSRPALMYAGRISREKGVLRLEQIDAELYARRVAFRLIVVGDGPALLELKARCPDAVFTGHLEHNDVGLAMASADIFLFPSETDTAGNVVLEAQASGLPVLVSDAGGPRENIADGATGFVCRAGDIRQFCDRLEVLLRCSQRRADMSVAARRLMLTRSWTASLTPLYASYRSLAMSVTPVRPATAGRRCKPSLNAGAEGVPTAGTSAEASPSVRVGWSPKRAMPARPKKASN